MTGAKAITRNTKLSSLMRKHPQAAILLLEKGLHCMGCAMASFETLEDGARAHGMTDKQIDRLVDQLNKVSQRKTKK